MTYTKVALVWIGNIELKKAVVEALAKMHEADPTKIGLESYGKLEGYLKRNEIKHFLF